MGLFSTWWVCNFIFQNFGMLLISRLAVCHTFNIPVRCLSQLAGLFPSLAVSCLSRTHFCVAAVLVPCVRCV